MLHIPEIHQCQINEQGSGTVGILKVDGVLVFIIGHQVDEYKGDEQGPFLPVFCHEWKETQRKEHFKEKQDFVLHRNLGQHIGRIDQDGLKHAD